MNDSTQARIVVALERLEHGNFSAIKGVGAGVFNTRLDFGPGYRIYCGKEGDRLVILLGGGTKKRQLADISETHTLWQEYKRRKRGKEDGSYQEFQRNPRRTTSSQLGLP